MGTCQNHNEIIALVAITITITITCTRVIDCNRNRPRLGHRLGVTYNTEICFLINQMHLQMMSYLY